LKIISLKLIGEIKNIQNIHCDFLKDFQIILEKTEVICENTVAFTFDAKSTCYEFEAGQYANFTLTDPKYPDEKGNSRALSFANAPNDRNKLVIAARINSSVFINNLCSLSPGSKLFVSKPRGVLTLHRNSSIPAIFISGGIGITPVRSIIEDVVNKKLPHRIKLFYSNKKETQIAFINDFMKWTNEIENLDFIPIIDDSGNKNWKHEFGPIDKAMLCKYLENFDYKMYYVTGPSIMVDSVKDLLLNLDVKKENVRTEKFE